MIPHDGPPDDRLLHVVMNGRVIGDVHRTGKHTVRLRYADGPESGFTPLSVSMPGPTGRYREATLAPWLEGLLPDRPETLRQWRRQFGVANDPGAFALLRHVGEDVAGAAQFVRPDRLASVQQRHGTLTELASGDVAEMLRRAKADLPLTSTANPEGRFSLAGAQVKIALHRGDRGWSDPSGAAPSTHILKPAIATLTDQDLAEAVTMRTGRALGLGVPRCAIEEFADERALVLERYDRVQGADGHWRRVHQEDMCQALALWPDRKYETEGGPGAGTVADLIHRTSERPEEDNRRFAQALVFNWLTCGTDAHARNYALMLSGASVRLAPLYDLNSFLAFSDGAVNDLSMRVNATFRASRITADDWVRCARVLQVDPDWIAGEVDRQRAAMLDAMSEAAAQDDVARYDSPVVARLLANTGHWLEE